MSNTPTRLYYETIERGNIVNKDTFDGIREDIESAIAAGQKEAIANTNISSHVSHKRTSGLSPLPKIEEDLNERGHWGSKAEFILSCVGFSVSCVYLLFDKFKRVCIKLFVLLFTKTIILGTKLRVCQLELQQGVIIWSFILKKCDTSFH